MIERTFHWAIEINDGVVATVIFFVVVAGLLAWSACLAWLDRRDEAMWEQGHQAGYAHGRRDERAELGGPGEFDLRGGDAHYPKIVETLGDGTQRRLDR